MWRLQAWFVPTSQEAWSSSAPDEGAALSGCDPPDERQRQCCPDNVSGNSLRSDERSTVIVPKIAAVERRKARVPSQGHAGAFAKVPQLYLRRFGAPPPSGRQKATRAKTFSEGKDPAGRDKMI